MDNKKYLTVKQAEERYGTSKWTLYLWATQGVVPSYKIGKLRRFAVDELDAHFARFKKN